MITIDQLNALRSRVEDLKGYLAIDAKRIEIAEEEKRTQDPEFWNNSKEAELVMKRLRTLKSWTQSFDACLSAVDDAQVLFEFMKAGEAEDSEAQEAFDAAAVAVEELEFKNMLSAEEDNLNAIMQITSGAGGTESCDWASMLMRMYRMYGDNANFKVKELDLQEGDVAGIKQVTLEFEGEFAFGMLKGKTGCTGWSASARLTAKRAGTRLSCRSMSIRWWTTPLKLRSIHRTSRGRHSVRAVPAARMSTRSKRVFASVTRRRASSLTTQKRAVSWATKRKPCNC